ncbi:unnamed protein product [Protopolystoma xenopodis]|uniref:Uncharacterized protein n=1 Tax=Protopolystoma xenopodis TaxID=117903 RepID=A0A448WHB1_9PLAT|nr:unnamed protein product [Protopolystoma xenopodis]
MSEGGVHQRLDGSWLEGRGSGPLVRRFCPSTTRLRTTSSPSPARPQPTHALLQRFSWAQKDGTSFLVISAHSTPRSICPWTHRLSLLASSPSVAIPSTVLLRHHLIAPATNRSPRAELSCLYIRRVQLRTATRIVLLLMGTMLILISICPFFSQSESISITGLRLAIDGRDKSCYQLACRLLLQPVGTSSFVRHCPPLDRLSTDPLGVFTVYVVGTGCSLVFSVCPLPDWPLSSIRDSRGP